MATYTTIEGIAGVDATGDRGHDLDTVYRAHGEAVSRWVKRLWGPRDAQDVFLDVFPVVQRRLPEFRGECAITTWLYAITVRVVVDRRKKENRASPAGPRMARMNMTWMVLTLGAVSCGGHYDVGGHPENLNDGGSGGSSGTTSSTSASGGMSTSGGTTTSSGTSGATTSGGTNTGTTTSSGTSNATTSGGTNTGATTSSGTSNATTSGSTNTGATTSGSTNTGTTTSGSTTTTGGTGGSGGGGPIDTCIINTTRTCRLEGCHGGAMVSAGLRLELDVVVSNPRTLVDRPNGGTPGVTMPGDATGCTPGAYKLIDSSNPENSLLYRKPTPASAVAMHPCGGKMPVIGTFLDADKACMLSWINSVIASSPSPGE